MIELTFKGSSLAEVFENMRQALGESDKKKKVAKKKESVKTKPEEDIPENEEAVDYKALRKEARSISLTLAKAKGASTQIKALLADEYGVTNAKDIPDESLERYLEKLKALEEELDHAS
ncbi:hypothetical protein HZZ02_04820 [Streptococcus danieliae]|nr:hypothetical protein [Streptococcus danieliae]